MFVLFDLISSIPLLSLINFSIKYSINPVIPSKAKLSQSYPEKKQVFVSSLILSSIFGENHHNLQILHNELN